MQKDETWKAMSNRPMMEEHPPGALKSIHACNTITTNIEPPRASIPHHQMYTRHIVDIVGRLRGGGGEPTRENMRWVGEKFRTSARHRMKVR